jgi:hypothetical protein
LQRFCPICKNEDFGGLNSNLEENLNKMVDVLNGLTGHIVANIEAKERQRYRAKGRQRYRGTKRKR